MSKWLEKIRSSDNSTKMRYLILLSGIAGIVVVILWAMTVRSIIESNATANSVVEKPDASFLEKIGSAWNGIVDRTKNTVKFFSEKVGKTNEITVDKTNN